MYLHLNQDCKSSKIILYFTSDIIFWQFRNFLSVNVTTPYAVLEHYFTLLLSNSMFQPYKVDENHLNFLKNWHQTLGRNVSEIRGKMSSKFCGKLAMNTCVNSSKFIENWQHALGENVSEFRGKLAQNTWAKCLQISLQITNAMDTWAKVDFT